MRNPTKIPKDNEEGPELIVGEKYQVASDCNHTGKVGTFIRLMRKGWAQLAFGKETGAFKRKSLICEGLVVKEEGHTGQKK